MLLTDLPFTNSSFIFTRIVQLVVLLLIIIVDINLRMDAAHRVAVKCKKHGLLEPFPLTPKGKQILDLVVAIKVHRIRHYFIKYSLLIN